MNKKKFLKKNLTIGLLLAFTVLILLCSYTLENFPLLIFGLLVFSSIFFLTNLINKNVNLIISSSLLSLFLVELILFLPNAAVIIKNEIKKKQNIHIKVLNNELGYQPKSGIQQHRIFHKDEELFNKFYSINDDNYRDTPEINNYKKKNKINFYGGSTVFGWGLSDNETLPYHLQKFFPYTKINNYSFSGYGIHQAYKQITEQKIFADLNILITFSNQIYRSSCKLRVSIGTPRYKLINNKISQKGYCNNFFKNNSKIYLFIKNVLDKSQIKMLISKAYFKKLTFEEDDINLYLNMIKEIDLYLKSLDKKLIVGFERKFDDESYVFIDQRIKNYLRENNILYLDITLKNQDKYEIPVDGHPNNLANINRAQTISKFIKNNNLFVE